MYTVVRFTGEGASVAALEEIGQELNRVQPGVYAAPHRTGDGFAVDVCVSDLWSDHAEAIAATLRTWDGALVLALQRGLSVCVDIRGR